MVSNIGTDEAVARFTLEEVEWLLRVITIAKPETQWTELERYIRELFSETDGGW